MMEKESLTEYQSRAEKYLADFGALQLNHFGIKAKDHGAYNDLKLEAGNILSEVNFGDRLIATAKKDGVILEILEPKPGEIVKETRIDHVSYKTAALDWLSEKLKDQIIAKFDVGNSHGIKIEPEEGLVIELRNNDIVESVKDFSKLE